MINTLLFIFTIGLIIILGYIGQLGFQKFRIPDVLILILIGIIIGPMLNMVSRNILISIMPIIAYIALIIIMFDAGLDLNFRDLRRSFKKTLILGILSYFITAVLITFVLAVVYHWFIKDCLIYGFIFAAPSVTVVSVLIKKLNIENYSKHVLIFEAAIADIFTVVITISLLSFKIFDQNSILLVSKGLALNFIVGLIIGLVAGIIWLELLRVVEKWEFSYTLTLALTFVIFAFVQVIGGSGLMAVIIFGLVLGNDDDIRAMISTNALTKKIFPLTDWKMSGQIQTFHSEVTFFIRTVLFVSLGLLVSANILRFNIILISIIVLLLIYGSRSLIILVLNLFESNNSSYLLGIIPRGLTQAVVALLVVTDYFSVPMNSLISTVIMVIIVTNIVASIFMFLKKPEST